MKSPGTRFLLALILSGSAHARLAETEDQLVHRFGKPFQRATEYAIAQGKILELCPQLTFRQADWHIICALIDGRCQCISYSKSGEWTEDQFEIILENNRQGFDWTDASVEMVKKLRREWKRSDGGHALWMAGVGFTVTAPAYDQAKSRLQAQAKIESAKIPNI